MRRAFEPDLEEWFHQVDRKGNQSKINGPDTNMVPCTEKSPCFGITEVQNGCGSVLIRHWRQLAPENLSSGEAFLGSGEKVMISELNKVLWNVNTSIKHFNSWKKTYNHMFLIWSLFMSTLNIHWKDWCWSRSSNTLATWCKEPTHWKRPWCWERLKPKGEEGGRGWDR